MRTLMVGNALRISVAAGLLTACSGGSQPPIGAPGAMPQGPCDRRARRIVDAARSKR